MLSFIFLADGPCDEASWRVNDDKNQWWSRRDALVRIVSTSLWQGTGQHNQVVRDSAFIFREAKEHSKQPNAEISHTNAISAYTNSVVVHQGQILTSTLAVPTERGLIRLWKEGFGRAAKAQLGVNISSLSDERGMLCSNAAWKELLLSNVPRHSAEGNHRQVLNVAVSKLDKRELLKLLQHNCDVEFLRKHSLNGPEALILKKKNRDAVLRAYEDWNSSSNGTPAIETSAADCSSSGSAASSVSYKRLVDTCKVLLGGMLSRAGTSGSNRSCSTAGPSGYLLLLHEDYPQELSVFGDSEVTDGSICRVPVVCAMGAVRDALDEEISALMEAARSLNMHCVGANLGRTAEFTSKIVTALVAHALADHLHAAVSALPVLHDSPAHFAGKQDGERAGAELRIQKLEPLRKGAWRWDGTSNKTSGKKRVRDDSNIEAPTPAVDCVQTTQHHMHIAAWIPVSIEEVTDDIDSRESLHGLIQLVVTSLWRSRLASEASQGSQHAATLGQDAPEDDNTDPSAKVIPVLYLIFRDGWVARLTQQKLAIAMANQHMAAPSEYQVLQMLIALLRQPDVVTRAQVGPGAAMPDILKRVLPAGLGKSARKAVRVVTLTDTLPVCFASGASISAKAVTDDKQRSPSATSLVKHAYAGKCSCSAAEAADSAQRYDIVLLINAPRSADCTLAMRRCMHEYVYPDKEVPAEERKLQKKAGHILYDGPLHSGTPRLAPPLAVTTLSGTPRLAPPLAVTTLQHFAYHDRLFAAIEGAIADT